MDKNKRFCQQLNHEKYEATQYCIFKECNLPQRFCCIECISNHIHNHSQSGSDHIIPCDKIQNFLKEKITPLYQEYQNECITFSKNYLSQALEQCIQIQNLISGYKKQIQQQIQYREDYGKNLIQLISNIAGKDFIKQDNDWIDQIFQIYQEVLMQNSLKFQKNFQTIFQKLNALYKIITDNNLIDLRSQKYIIRDIDSGKFVYYSSDISKDEKYLAYGSQQNLIRIYDIKLNQIIKEIKLKNQITVCQFTQNSQQLYIGVYQYVYGYDCSKNFNQIFYKQIHQDYVYNIIIIKNQQIITCSGDKTIISTDIKSQKQLFKLIGHTNTISALEFNGDDEIIISGSDDQSIKAWKYVDKSIVIAKQNSHNSEIKQIQLINNGQNILSLDYDGILFNWKRDLQKKELIKFQQYIDQNHILNFYSINQGQYLLIIGKQQVKILSNSGELINKIDLNPSEYLSYYDCRQLNNARYIQIRIGNKIQLAIAIE